MENFKIKTYGKSELALLYFPDAQSKIAALQNLHYWISRNEKLVFELNTVVDACVTLIYLRSQYPRVRFIDALKIKRLMMDVDGCSQLAFPAVVTLSLQFERWRLLTSAQHNPLSMA